MTWVSHGLTVPALVVSTTLAVAVLFQPVTTRAAELSVLPDTEPAAIDPLRLTDPMRAFIDARVRRDLPRQSRVLRLRDAIFDPDKGLGITYGSSATHTAAGTFEAGSGNCLSFTLLYVSLAQYLGLEAYFIEVDEVTGWSQRGDVGISYWHMYAEVELDNGVMQVDFLPWSERRYRSRRRISETRVRAHFFNNIGAEVLTNGDSAAAAQHFERALTLDPTFSPARVNLAVAKRRLGHDESAEKALLQVLGEEPANSVAATNLASLYLAQGREEDAQEWLAQRDRFLRRNPFHHFRLGMKALAANQPSAARDHFKRAISRQPDEGIFFEQLAESHRRLGETRKARSALRRALHWTDDADRRQQLEDRLRKVSASGVEGDSRG